LFQAILFVENLLLLKRSLNTCAAFSFIVGIPAIYGSILATEFSKAFNRSV
jgi:undecaprenyl pyrophosphate phosphatase UppP